MLVVPIGLQHLFSALSLQRKSLVIFYPKWQPRALEKLLASLSQFSPHMVEEVFVVKSFGGDETESYLIDVLRVSQVPHIAVYAGLNLVAGGSNWKDVIQHLYLPWSLRQQSWRQYSPGIDYISTVLAQAPPTSLPTVESRNSCIQLFISGDRSSVGKSTVCLLLLASLVRQGVAPGSLAYIKPVTQCEATQPVTHYCHQLGIATVEVSPVIFYQGFTRTFLAGETETAEEMLQRIGGVVQNLSVGKRLVIVDGVGYPSVGSICSLSNADVARSLEAPVMLVGKPGVGDAVDSFNLLSAFFEYNRVHVLGAIFNKLETQGFYALEHCRGAINQYFTQQKPHQMPFGYLPKTTELRGLDQLISTDKSSGQVHIDFGLLDEWTLLFLNHVDLHRLIFETWKAHITRGVFQFPDSTTIISSLAGSNHADTPYSASRASLATNADQNLFQRPPLAPGLTPAPAPQLSSSFISAMPPSLGQVLSPATAAASILVHGNSKVNASTNSMNTKIISSPAPTLSGGKRSREEIEALSRDQGAKRQQ